MSMTMTVSRVLFNLCMSLRCSKVKKTRSKNSGLGVLWGFYGVLDGSWWFLVSFSIHDVHHWLAVTCRDLLKVGGHTEASVCEQPMACRWTTKGGMEAQRTRRTRLLQIQICFRSVQIVQIVQICSDRSAFAFCAQNCHGKQGLYGFVHSYVAIPRRSNR